MGGEEGSGVVITTIGKFWSFDLARELFERGMLERIFTGYPRFQLRGEQLPASLIASFPYLHTPYMALSRFLPTTSPLQRELAWNAAVTLDQYVASKLPRCSAFIGLSGTGLVTGQKAQKRGAIHICDRGSTHIRYQARLLAEESQHWGISTPPVDRRMIEREEAEYAQADLITVPSTITRNSFLEMGIPADKVVRIPYGVNMSRFSPTGTPNAERFDILFAGAASVRKGVPYLLEAFAKLSHPRKQLTFAGPIHTQIQEMIDRDRHTGANIVCLGKLSQAVLRDVMSTHHVLVLPSIEEGLALVQAQALACGCPVIATANTGAEDLFSDGVEGYILPIRQSDAILSRLEFLAAHPEMRGEMSKAALRRVQSFGGWKQYGDTVAQLIRTNTKASQAGNTSVTARV